MIHIIHIYLTYFLQMFYALGFPDYNSSTYAKCLTNINIFFYFLTLKI